MATAPALTNNPTAQLLLITAAANTNDITGVVATLASRQSGRPQSAPLSGPKRAAIMMLALGEKYGAKVWSILHDDEVRELSGVMANRSAPSKRKLWKTCCWNSCRACRLPAR